MNKKRAKAEFNPKVKDQIIKKEAVNDSPPWLEAKIDSLNVGESKALLKKLSKKAEREKLIKDYTVELEMKQIELENLYLELEEEINKAEKMHNRILIRDFPRLKDYQMTAFYQPAENIGGDFYNFIKKDNKLVMYISDVTGHGLEAAMMSSFIKSTIKSYLAASATSDLNPAEIVKFLSQRFFEEDYPEDYFICITMLVLDLETDIISYTTQGMQEPILVHSRGEKEPRLKKLLNKGLPISPVLEMDLFNFEVQNFQLKPGDTLIFNTDGITEAVNKGVYYKDRFQELFAKIAFLPPEIISQKIRTDFLKFNNGAQQTADDISYLILKKYRQNKGPASYQIASSRQAIIDFQSRIYGLLPNSLKSDFFAMGLHELVVNAAEHGNKMEEKKQVEVELIINDSYFYAEIKDQGAGFDWRSSLNNHFDIKADSSSDRGRGVMMTEEGCDEFFYNQKGNKAYLFIRNEL